jgi:hypothetical protein
LQRQIDVATGKLTPQQADADRIKALTDEVARLSKATGSPRTVSMEDVKRLQETLAALRQIEVAAGKITPQQAEQAALEDRVTLLRAEQNGLGQRTTKNGDTDRELKIRELQRQIDLATGKITPAQAATERLNILTAEVARLRKETGSARTASEEEVNRLREALTELRQLEIAAGRITPQQAEQAAKEDRVALLRAEQNALRNAPGQQDAKGRDPERDLKIKELQWQIDVATGRMTPGQADAERIKALKDEVARLLNETGRPQTASMDEVERLRQLLTELRQLEVAAGQMTPQQAEQAAAKDQLALLRGELNALLNERDRRNRKGSDRQIAIGRPNSSPSTAPLRKPFESSQNKPVASGSAGSSGASTSRAIDRLSGDGMGGGGFSGAGSSGSNGAVSPGRKSSGSVAGRGGTVTPSQPMGSSGISTSRPINNANSARPMGSSGISTVNSQSGNAPIRSGGGSAPLEYGGCSSCNKPDTFRQPK